jgi:hypothetical protein
MLLALAASLINRRCCNAADAAQQYALAFDEQRGYGGSAVKVCCAEHKALHRSCSLSCALRAGAAMLGLLLCYALRLQFCGAVNEFFLACSSEPDLLRCFSRQ